MTFDHIRLLGVDRTTGEKLLLTVAVIVLFAALRWILAKLTKTAVPPSGAARALFWMRQVLSVVLLVALVLSLVSVWFDDAGRLATVGGLFTAGIAVALQRVITAFAAYLIILRGSTFTVGDRIVMGDVRGDVIALDPFQTTIMEMGESSAEQPDAPAIWVHGRQFTGRIVTVNNGAIFDKPVYNFTRDFPYLWEEIMIPISYDGPDSRAEEIILAAVRRHAVDPKAFSEDQRVRLEQRYGLALPEAEPRTFYRLTDNWIAIAARFLVPDHGSRQIKDKIYREILAAFRAEKIGIASGTYAIVQVPPIKLEPSDGAPSTA